MNRDKVIEDVSIEMQSPFLTFTFFKKKDEMVDFAADYDADMERLNRQFNTGNFNTSFNTQPEPTSANDLFGEPPVLVDETNDTEQWQPHQPTDQHLLQRTTEERKQQRINYVLGERHNDRDTFIDEEDEGDEIAKIMEQIDLLKNNLEAEGIDLKRIPEISVNATKKEAKAVLRILQIKNDRLRYCDMFEEGILAAAYGLESMFDGKRVWFGTQIDLVGWPDSVKVKLRRMRYDTSTFVGELVRGYNINSGWRILFELLPSLFLYSRERRTKSSDNLISDDKYKNAINELNN